MRMNTITKGLVSLGFLTVAGCTTTGNATLGTIATDAASIVNELQSVVTADPTLFGKNSAAVNAAIADAESVLGKISASTPSSTGASVVAQINADINTVLTVASTLPLIPPPYDLAVGAAAALAPLVEGWVDSTLNLTGATAPKAWAKLATPGMTTAQARAKLASLQAK